jgi:hypothetical protein
MQEVRRRRDVAWLGLRAHVPDILRALALVLGAGAVLFIAYSLTHTRREHEFVLKKGKAELSSNVVRRVENYEMRRDEGGRLCSCARRSRLHMTTGITS